MSMNSSSSSITEMVLTQARALNETVDGAKEKASQAYNGLKDTVEKHMILSIVLSVFVVSLLILCCYLRRKYSRSAQVVSRKEYEQILKNRQVRTDEVGERRAKEQRWAQKAEQHPASAAERKARRAARRAQRRGGAKDEAQNIDPNTSYETMNTAISNDDINFVDMENGEGFEVDASPSKNSPRNPSNDAFDQNAAELEQRGSSEKRSFFSRKK
jgi:hypothetical protein